MVAANTHENAFVLSPRKRTALRNRWIRVVPSTLLPLTVPGEAHSRPGRLHFCDITRWSAEAWGCGRVGVRTRGDAETRTRGEKFRSIAQVESIATRATPVNARPDARTHTRAAHAACRSPPRADRTRASARPRHHPIVPPVAREPRSGRGRVAIPIMVDALDPCEAGALRMSADDRRNGHPITCIVGRNFSSVSRRATSPDGSSAAKNQDDRRWFGSARGPMS